METYDKQADWVGALKETFWGILNIIYISTALACSGSSQNPGAPQYLALSIETASETPIFFFPKDLIVYLQTSRHVKGNAIISVLQIWN